MRLTLGFYHGSTNCRTSISNLPTHFLLRLWHRRTRPVWAHGTRVERALSKTQLRAIYNLLRLRAVKRGVLQEAM